MKQLKKYRKRIKPSEEGSRRTVSLSLDSEVLKDLDAFAFFHEESRSSVVERILRETIGGFGR